MFFYFGLVITFLIINVIANYDLFRSEYLTDFKFNEYIQDLISEIISSYSTVSNTVKVNQILVDILNANAAIPCGLILNQLLTNCFKHPIKGVVDSEILFHSQRKGISIKCKYKIMIQVCLLAINKK